MSQRESVAKQDGEWYECEDCGWSGPEDKLEDGCCPECGSEDVEETFKAMGIESPFFRSSIRQRLSPEAIELAKQFVKGGPGSGQKGHTTEHRAAAVETRRLSMKDHQGAIDHLSSRGFKVGSDSGETHMGDKDMPARYTTMSRQNEDGSEQNVVLRTGAGGHGPGMKQGSEFRYEHMSYTPHGPVGQVPRQISNVKESSGTTLHGLKNDIK